MAEVYVGLVMVLVGGKGKGKAEQAILELVSRKG